MGIEESVGSPGLRLGLEVTHASLFCLRDIIYVFMELLGTEKSKKGKYVWNSGEKGNKKEWIPWFFYHLFPIFPRFAFFHGGRDRTGLFLLSLSLSLSLSLGDQVGEWRNTGGLLFGYTPIFFPLLWPGMILECSFLEST